jgi:hypothetical protein
MFVSPHMPPVSSEDAEEADLVLVDVLAPSFLFPASVQHKELVKECVERLKLSSDRQLKVTKKKKKGEKKFIWLNSNNQLYYLIDTETREQQNHRMAVLVQETKFSLPFVDQVVESNDVLRDRLNTSLEAFSSTYSALQAAKFDLAQEKTRRKVAEAKVKELEKQIALQKRGTV